ATDIDLPVGDGWDGRFGNERGGIAYASLGGVIQFVCEIVCVIGVKFGWPGGSACAVESGIVQNPNNGVVGSVGRDRWCCAARRYRRRGAMNGSRGQCAIRNCKCF